MANFITLLRIVFCIALLFFAPLSIPFYIFYALAGCSDMIDGFVARKTNTTSDFGAKLDTIADFVMMGICFVKLYPVLQIELWMLIWLICIGLIKIYNLVFCFIKYKQFGSVHSVMNKITGLLLFLLPFTLSFLKLKYSAILLLPMATFSAMQEGYFLIKKKE